MKQGVKRFCILLIVSLISLSSTAQAAEAKFPKLEQPVFVQDHAKLMNQADKDKINKKGQKLQSGTDADILLMTMKSVGQTPRQDYALEAGRHYKVGDQKHNRGIVILLNMDNGNEYNNRGIEIAVGDGLEGVLNDSKVGALIDEHFMPYQKKAANAKDAKQAKMYYSEGLTALYNAVWDEIADSYGYDGKKFTEKEPQSSGLGKGPFIIFLILIIFYFIIYFFKGGGKPPKGGSRRGRRRGMAGPYISGGSSSGGFGGGFSGGGGFGGGGGFSGGGAGRGF
ncbi:TPM domain-containing protein [Mammaliicoccus sp. Dog046]|uniref:TPM domain-containing protein n=1 Tax=Mammaliicoccus sp. Dog046 TaxID=3034233 RepID=UPI002B25C6DE|nr:TPM domain-containing protein [Mammaliicoccus sp. Dog046]WQK86428.1 TPM domain-containing protein [Mammaliicoccus sp. Dog046]